MILVHHLRVGRSVFTVWLLEEMGLDYELKIYDRLETGRAPPELKNAHPLGKSPVIEIDGMLMAESGAIASYLADKYDPEGKFAPPRSDEKARAVWTQWLHYSEGSAFTPLLLKLLLARAPDAPDAFKDFATGEVDLHLGYMQDNLGDKEFLLGDKFQIPDIGFTYICHMAERLGELGPYAKLDAYMKRNMARPAFQRAAEKTGG